MPIKPIWVGLRKTIFLSINWILITAALPCFHKMNTAIPTLHSTHCWRLFLMGKRLSTPLTGKICLPISIQELRSYSSKPLLTFRFQRVEFKQLPPNKRSILLHILQTANSMPSWIITPTDKNNITSRLLPILRTILLNCHLLFPRNMLGNYRMKSSPIKPCKKGVPLSVGKKCRTKVAGQLAG